MSDARPKITVPKTTAEKVWDVVGLTFYVGTIILLLINWSNLPSEVPAHYNVLGEVDRWGKKLELFILPLVGGFLFLIMHVLEKHPESHNYPKRLNDSNREAFYLNSRKMLNQLKNCCLIVLSCILFESITIAMGWLDGFGEWFMPILLIGVFLPITFGILQQRKIK